MVGKHRSCNQIALPLEDKYGLPGDNLTMSGRSVFFAVEIRFVGFALSQNGIDGNEQHSGDSGKGLDAQHRRNEVNLREILFRNGEDKGLHIQLAEGKPLHVGTDKERL